MDIQDIRTLLLDLNCMTVLRFCMDTPAVSALIDLCVACVDDRIDEEQLTETYCRVYNAWLDTIASGHSGFAHEVLETILYEDSAVARICSKTDELPYSMMSGLGHDLEVLGKLTAIEPALFLLFCERAGMPGGTAVRLPVWEPEYRGTCMDTRLHRDMLSRDGAKDVIRFFRRQGTGVFARYAAATWEQGIHGLRGVAQPDPIQMSDLILYESQHETLVENTRRLLQGLNAGNILLYGDKGTGKSASVKALLNDFWQEGLRIVEVRPQCLTDLPEIFVQLRTQPCKFIVFVDDLAFNDSCPEYTALKTVLEGGLEVRPQNVVVYATSNRRNIVRQSFSEREDDVNARDTLEEKFSLADRFDLRLTFQEPTQDQYFSICQRLIESRGMEVDWGEIMPRARAWTLSHGGRSPRVARQFVDALESELAEKQSAADAASDESETV
ncbi:MAG: ATP-binding protein [Clostridia bacterium]|nr:ATP-binding protein [Clostridia bacterium]